MRTDAFVPLIFDAWTQCARDPSSLHESLLKAVLTAVIFETLGRPAREPAPEIERQAVIAYIVGNGGEESACGWCKDKWGLSWQITPKILSDSLSYPDRAAAKRVFDAMMTMKKIDIATLEAAQRGG